MFSQKTYWQKIASSTAELASRIPPNKYLKLTIRGRQIIVGKVENNFFALRDKCPHQGKSLSHGYHENGKAICIYHRFSFDVNTGVGSCGGVDSFPIEIRETGIFIGVQYLSIFGF